MLLGLLKMQLEEADDMHVVAMARTDTTAAQLQTYFGARQIVKASTGHMFPVKVENIQEKPTDAVQEVVRRVLDVCALATFDHIS